MNDALRLGGRALGFALVAFLLLPFVALAVTLSDGDFERAVDRGLWDALWLSLGSTTLAVGLLALTGNAVAQERQVVQQVYDEIRQGERFGDVIAHQQS